jgi:hypothetical protein
MDNKETARPDYEEIKKERKKGEAKKLLDNSNLVKEGDRR